MSIKDELAAELKEAMRARDRGRLDVIRQINAGVENAVTAPGFAGGVDDELYREIIAAYAKKMAKALAEYESYGDRGAEAAAKLRFEVDYLQRWLPKGRSVAEVEQLVRAALADLDIGDPKQAGRVTGQVMKAHPGLDGAMVNRTVLRLLDSE